MSILNIDKLLSPVTEDEPCGEDLSDLTEYYVLEEQVKGKEETQFSEAEPPDWPQVERLACDLLLQGKEMWVIAHLLCAMTATHGIAGLNEGINFLSQALVTFWEGIFPEKDLDDANPYEQRMNILNSLSNITSPLMQNIKLMPICQSRQLGKFTYRDIQLSSGELKVAEGETLPEINLIEAAVRDTDPEYITDMIRQITETIEEIRKIEDFLDEAAGNQNNTSDILKIEDALKSILNFVAPLSGPQVQDEDLETKQPNEGRTGDQENQVPSRQAPVTGTSGALNSRDDVSALLNEMIRWYEKNEPASPVAMIIDRAKSLVGKNFVNIVSSIMGPDIPEIQTLFGPPEDQPVPEKTPVAKQTNFNIQSRSDILNWMNKAGMWYYDNEPSSPVPLFIHRAQQLVGKNFHQIISEIAGQAEEQVTDLLKNK